MGLFSNNKKQCPICGNATPRLLATKVEGMPICSDCANKMDIRPEVRESLTVDKLQAYMAFYEENLSLKKEFKSDFEHRTGGLLSLAGIFCDFTHGTFRLSAADNATVYTPESFEKFLVLEGDTPVIELTKDALCIYKSSAPAQILELKEEITKYNEKLGMTEMLKSAQKDMRHAEEYMKARENGERWNEFEYQQKEREMEWQTQNQSITPIFHPAVPFKKWKIVITISHEWGGGIEDTDNAVWFKDEYPSVQEGLDNYYNSFEQYKQLAMAIKRVCCPNSRIEDASERIDALGNPVGQFFNTQNAQPAASTSAVDEIKKFKELLDQGIITQEEFDVKKKQLLGL